MIMQRKEQGKDVEHFGSLQNPLFVYSIPSFCSLINIILYINFYSKRKLILNSDLDFSMVEFFCILLLIFIFFVVLFVSVELLHF